MTIEQQKVPKQFLSQAVPHCDVHVHIDAVKFSLLTEFGPLNDCELGSFPATHAAFDLYSTVHWLLYAQSATWHVKCR